MTEISHESVDCVVLDTRPEVVAKGHVWYRWHDERRSFPADVVGVYIGMPLTYSQAYPDKDVEEFSPGFADRIVEVHWATTHSKNSAHQHHWTLSGTFDKPTLSPSLNWIGRWHGHLRDGRLESC